MKDCYLTLQPMGIERDVQSAAFTDMMFSFALHLFRLLFSSLFNCALLVSASQHLSASIHFLSSIFALLAHFSFRTGLALFSSPPSNNVCLCLLEWHILLNIWHLDRLIRFMDCTLCSLQYYITASLSCLQMFVHFTYPVSPTTYFSEQWRSKVPIGSGVGAQISIILFTALSSTTGCARPDRIQS